MTFQKSTQSNEERFLNSYTVNALTGCRNWFKAKDSRGYGVFRVGKKLWGAHRWAYFRYVGEVPKGLHLDHLCENPACVNVEHLEPVTPMENLRRHYGVFNSPETECIRGHEYNANSVRYDSKNKKKRVCSTCVSLKKPTHPLSKV